MGKVVTLSLDAIVGSLVAVVLAIGTGVVTGYFAGLEHGKTLGRQEKARELQESTERDRYTRLYVPLKRLFEDCFLTICRLTRYPTFSQRMRRSLRFLMRGRLKGAATALVDSGISEAAEFECGSSFPIEKIEILISDNLDVADQELQNLTGALRRRQFDDYQSPSNAKGNPWKRETSLSKEELSLYRHIHSEYDKLNSRFTIPS
jgi:hypothetical protein